LDPLIYFFAEHYPWWGIPMGIIMVETANHFRRNGKRPQFAVCAGLSIVFFALSILYFTNNGFQSVRPLLHSIEKSGTK